MASCLMEYFLLLVFAILWWILRSRDRQDRERQSYYLNARLSELEAKVRGLVANTATPTSPETTPPAAYAAPPPPMTPRPEVKSSDVWPQGPPIREKIPSEHPDPVYQEVISPAAPVTSGVGAGAGNDGQTPPQMFSSHRTFDPTGHDAPEHLPLGGRLNNLEERLGTNWLNKLGIVILVFGVSLFLAFQLRTLGPLGKVLVGYAVCATLLIGSLVLERRHKYRIFVRAGIGGGWALTFFTTYAMYHIPATHVLSSQGIDLALMLFVAVGMVWHSLRYESQVVTGLAFLLAFSTVTISHVTVFSLVASGILAVGLVYVTSREHWVELELAGLVCVYLNHFLWLKRLLPATGGPGHPFPEFFPSVGLIVFYWLVFRLAYVRRVPRSDKEELVSTVAAVLNSAGVLVLLRYQSFHREWAFLALLAFGVAEMLLAFYSRGRRRIAFIVLSTIASALLLAAIPFRFSGSNWSVLWLLEMETLLFCGLRMRETVFRRLGILAGFAAAIQLAMSSVAPIYIWRQVHLDSGRHVAVALVLACGAILYWLNAQTLPRFWKELVSDEPDRLALRFTSYLGLVAAGACLWVFFSASLTVVAWMTLAVILGWTADKVDSVDLALQCDLIATAAFLRILAVNLLISDHWGPLSQRAVTVLAASALVYVCTWRKKVISNISPVWIPTAYSWAGSVLLGLLAWYELLPISVAVAWGILGLVLFEIGYIRNKSYLRYQGYALLLASFIRIFFANMNAGSPTHWLTPRVYTVLPLVAAYYWTYERLEGCENSTRLDRIFGLASAHLGTIALAALAYFEIRSPWVVDAWAVLVFLTIVAGWTLKRQVFVAQGLVLALAVFLRAILYNLHAAPLAGSSYWEGRIACISVACAIIFLTLPMAFRIRRLEAQKSVSSNPLIRWLHFAISRPEQLLFFTPLLLVTVMLTREMRAGLITVSWSALGVAVFLIALLIRERSYRLAGLALLLLGVAKILFVDVWKLAPADRYITLIVMGAALLLVSFLYTRYRGILLKFL